MNNDFWKTLYAWLETASPEDITAKRHLVRHMRSQSNDPGLQADIRRVLRLLDEETFARAELAMTMPLSKAA
ncbi:MAG: hypothetical protein Q7V20_20775 [Aquabacterium sp.]|uniref:hypothetical protein n=1 Tax=Aquabacterium sp. TaxID=1872578 RepID=UPI002717E825|nr:hypothetical protein [Aquabacterium sp.]MDO9005886.1 hypothetical protein [Aquabacterium sp.]